MYHKELYLDRCISLAYLQRSQRSTECYNKVPQACQHFHHVKIVQGLTSTMLKLYKAFVLPHVQYGSGVWHFCSSRSSETLESLNKRAMCVVFNDRESAYSQLLDRAAVTSLYNLRVQNMLITIHKCIHINFYLAYLKDSLTFSSTVYFLRGTDILSLCRPASTSYGLHSFKYFACM